MKFKALALAAITMMSGSAFAFTINVAPGSTTSFSGSFADGATQSINFHVSTPSFGGAFLQLYTAATAPIPLFSGTLNGLALTPISGPLGPVYISRLLGSAGPSETFSLVLNGTKGDSTEFQGFFGVTTAVPEPGSLALMLAGLGVVGFTAARRRKTV